MRLFVSRRLPVAPQDFVGDGITVEVYPHERAPTREELLDGVRDADGLVCLLSDRIDRPMLEAAPRLRVVACYSVGVDNVDLAAATARGVQVTNTPDVLTDATADLAFTLLLAVARRVREGERLLRSGGFHGWAPTMLLGHDLAGRTLGIFGFGRIGQAMARRARGFGMQVLYTSRSAAPPALEAELRALRVELPELLARADVLSLHAPLAPGTRHVLGRAELSRLQPHAILVNTARGALVDEAALVEALQAGRLAGAGLDVFEEEPRVHPGLLDRDDVVLLPHVGSATFGARRAMAERALGDAARVLRGEAPRFPVNRLAVSR